MKLQENNIILEQMELCIRILSLIHILHEYKGDEISMLEKYCNIDQLLNTMLEK